MKASIYDPARERSRDCGSKEGPEVGELLREVRAINPALADEADLALSDLTRDGRACDALAETLEELIAGEISVSTAEKRLADTYRENLPESMPVEAAIERLYTA